MNKEFKQKVREELKGYHNYYCKKERADSRCKPISRIQLTYSELLNFYQVTLGSLKKIPKTATWVIFWMNKYIQNIK